MSFRYANPNIPVFCWDKTWVPSKIRKTCVTSCFCIILGESCLNMLSPVSLIPTEKKISNVICKCYFLIILRMARIFTDFKKNSIFKYENYDLFTNVTMVAPWGVKSLFSGLNAQNCRRLEVSFNLSN